jgi:DNA ligase D-like protein (predicted ligase)
MLAGMLGGTIKPMEPVSRKDPFDSAKHVFEVKWDGVRTLAFCERHAVRLQNRNLHDRTVQYPELQCLSSILEGKQALLDGEVIALREGRPSFFDVMRRDACRTPDQARRVSRVIPVSFMIFDILALDGKSIANRPLSERKQLLAGALAKAEPPVYAVDYYPNDGKALYRVAGDRGLEGIVAKEWSSPYLMGRKSPYWVKVKHSKKQACVVGGYTSGAGGSVSLLAGAYAGGILRYIGRVGSGISSADSSRLVPALSSIHLAGPALEGTPTMRDAVWVEPVLTFVAQFYEWTEDFKMRSPVFVGFSDLRPDECTVPEG